MPLGVCFVRSPAPFEAMRVETGSCRGPLYSYRQQRLLRAMWVLALAPVSLTQFAMGDWKRSTFGGYFTGLLAENAEGKRPTILAFICERSLNPGRVSQ